MRRYWVIVRRSNQPLFEALRATFSGRHGFTVILDRRALATQTWPLTERRRAQVWEADDLVIAEEQDS
jgi:hypothetical protein